jgi:ubiquinone/menaquinone biosynthesis C-methylase UbiE
VSGIVAGDRMSGYACEVGDVLDREGLERIVGILMEQQICTKVNSVRRVFEAPERYLNGSGFNIRIRRETVLAMVGGARYDNILDIGCGNGSISLPLLRPDNRISLADISSRMIAIARSNVPASLAGNVQFVNDDFMTAELEPRTYDLIVCLGVLAHVDSPAASLARIAALLRPGGRLILEFTDAFHVSGRPRVLYHRLLNLWRPQPYALNLLSRRTMDRLLASNDLKIAATYRYSLWLPRLGTVLSQDQLYRLVRAIYGSFPRGRNAFLGNQYICLVRHR